MKLSENFYLEEFTVSPTAMRNGIDNTPSLAEVKYLEALVDNVLQPVRTKFGAVHVTSGFRCNKLNSAIGGSKTSEHRYGMAADFKAESMALVFNYMRKNLKFTQLIWEFGDDNKPSWIHVSYDPNNLKCQVLQAYKEKGRTKYKTI